MAKCPKCGAPLHIYNVSQFCPKCGVNMRYVNFEENFLKEAKIAELTQAVVHMKVRRLKAALIGGKLQIVRLVIMILPLVSMLIPSGSYTVSLPYYSHSVQFGLLGLYGVFTNGDLAYIGDMCSSLLFGDLFKSLKMTVFVYAVPAVFSVIVFLASVLCFISIKNMQKIIAGISCVGALTAIVSAAFIFRFSSATSGNAVLSASSGFGWLVTAAAFAAVAVMNIIIDKKGIDVVYDEGVEERVAVYRKYKNGEVSIDDLPQPVVETAETRKIDEEIAKEEALVKANSDGEAAK